MKKKRSINYRGYFHPWSIRSWRKHWGWTKKLENVPWAPKEEIRKRSVFPQNTGHSHSHSVSAAMVGSRVYLKAWVGLGPPRSRHQDEVRQARDLLRERLVKDKGSKQEQAGKALRTWAGLTPVKGEREGGLVGRALDWYTVLGKSWVGPRGVLWQKLPHGEVAHWDARPLVEGGQNRCALTAKSAGESKSGL